MKYDIKQLTLDEKLALLCGKDGWRLETANGKLPSVWLSDGPNGLRKRVKNEETGELTTVKATAMPNIHLIANTWDPELAYLDGATIADECLENDVDVLLAPGVNIKRTPLCGRNFEYFSEDPYLAGTLAKAYIEGVQSKGVGTSLKHYCLNNREFCRTCQSSEVDERTLREIYLPAFEIALQAKPWTVMCSYNLVNGVWASENKWLLQDILRDEFGYDGVIVSDWNAVRSGWRAVKASLDLCMPYRFNHFENVKTAYENGWLTEEEIDACITRLLAFMEKTQTQKQSVTTTKEQRHENAVKIVREGIVLMKNDDGILPLKQGNIFVGGGWFNTCNAYGGGGSAYVQSEYLPQPLHEQLAERLGDKANVFADVLPFMLRQEYELCSRADVAVLCVGTGKNIEFEGGDRTDIRLPIEQEEFIVNCAKRNPNTVVVLNTGSAIDVSAWVDKVKAVVLLGFAGEGGMEALADILTGKACPCGKLSETFPVCLEDTPTGSAHGNGFYERYDEGVFVGYRWFDSKEKQVQFPFGYGLSYAKFEYSDMQIKKLSETDYEVSFTVTNVGDCDAKEISQLYVRDVCAMVSRPDKELKDFVKTSLKAGESKRVSMNLNYRSFAFYSVPLKKWHIENGDFDILIGASSRDIRLQRRIEITLPETEQYTKTAL
ncbi:MAG: glycosyl hydrolase [Clostridiales bacterium]|nr:glycosyl hydrolase [Clostridiales bacterium]